MLVERREERTLWRELARESARELARDSARELARESAREFVLESARELARESARELARESTRELARELICELAKEFLRELVSCTGMREPGREVEPREVGLLVWKRVGVNLESSWLPCRTSILLRIVACEGERLLLSCELRPDSRDKLLKSLSGELERELCCERSRRLRTGIRDTESRRMDKSEGVSRCAAS